MTAPPPDVRATHPDGSDFTPPPVTDSHILVVDDIEWNRALIGTLLEEAGYSKISYAVDGEDALAKIAESTPDLLILDIMMPGLDGFEVCRRLRANHAYADLPVLVQTALFGVEDRNRAFEAGTTDLVTKPLDRTELLARVRIHLENRALIRSLLAYRARLEGELDVARGVFEHLLPGEATITALAKANNLDIRSHILRPSDLGGDIWGMLPLADGSLGVFLLDMAGRDVSAALNVCRLHTLVQELVGLGHAPDKFLGELNRRAHELLIVGEHAAMIYGVVSPTSNSFTYACAAATGPLLLLPDGRVIAGEGAGPALGVVAEARFGVQSLPFPDRAALMLHSKGLLNAFEDRSEAVGSGSVLELLSGLWANTDRTTVFTGIAEKLDQVVGNPPKDNHTLVWLGRDDRSLGA